MGYSAMVERCVSVSNSAAPQTEGSNLPLATSPLVLQLDLAGRSAARAAPRDKKSGCEPRRGEC